MIDRQLSGSPWSQTMNRIHSPPPGHESVNNSSHIDRGTTKIMPLQDESSTNPIPRKRNNSLIPIELMMNNNEEGGRERAALATVFGVPEYIDSKIFWERQQYQNEGFLPKKQQMNLMLTSTITTTRPNNNSTMSTNEKYGYVSVKDISIIPRPLSSVGSTNNEEEDIILQQHENQSKFVISSYIDQVLDPVGASDLLKPSFPGSGPAPQPSISFALPRIPTVSKFNEDENGFDIMFPAEPSSIAIHSSTPMIKSDSSSSINSSLVLTSQSAKPSSTTTSAVKPNSREEDTESIDLTSRLVVIIGPPEIFDLIVSDDDERFIIWGPDPIVLSSSMATTTTPESAATRFSSYATLYNNQQNKRPELKGFSSNATSTTLIRSKSLQQQRPSFASIRLSTWSEGLRGKHSSPQLNTDRPALTSNGSFLLKKAFGLKNKRSETGSSTTNTVTTIKDSDIPKVIEAATIHKLVEKLTNTLDYTFMTDFFLTYRDFLYSEDLCQLLVSRFYWALQNDEESRRIVRIRTFVVLRHWLNNYFVHDFIGNRPLRQILTEFLNNLPRHPLVKASPRDQRIVKILKRVVRRLKKLYYNRSSGASRVKVIAPPPPTAEQEEMGEIVRAKLSQNAIRRKTALGVDMSSHHHGNMAVQDARYAPVVVVGSLNMKGSFIDSGVVDSSKLSRRNPSVYSAPVPPTPTSPTSPTTTNEGQVIEDTHTIRSSIHHRYDKSVHEASGVEPGNTHAVAANVEASSVMSVASDDSLESELSAGETIPDEESDEEEEEEVEEYQSRIHQESFGEYDERDHHWLEEQQETLDYFRSLSSGTNNTPGMSHSSSLSQSVDTNHSQLLLENGTTPLPNHITHPSSTSAAHPRPKIPPEFIQADNNNKAIDMTSEVSSIPSPATPTNSNGLLKNETAPTPRTIRRVPSERWCKTDDEQHQRHPLDLDDKILPDEVLKELSSDEAQHKSPIGLSRKLSKKSIERRKSEKSLQDAAAGWSSAASSATTSPYLSGVINPAASDIPDVPVLPPLTSEMFETPAGFNKSTGSNSPAGGSGKKVIKKKKSLLLNKRKQQQAEATIDAPDVIETFASVPYEATKVNNKEEESKEDDATSKSPPKRRLSRVLTKVFRPGHDEKSSVAATAAKNSTIIAAYKASNPVEGKPVEPFLPNEAVAPATTNEEEEKKPRQQQGGGQFVSLIAQRLRHTSVDESDSEGCDCAKCSGNKGSATTCRRLSMMMIADNERRRSFELRRKRGASIDMIDRPDFLKNMNNASVSRDRQANGKENIKSGPVYLGHLQARSVIGGASNIDGEEEEEEEHRGESDSDDDDDDDTASFATSERSIQTEAQASSSRAASRVGGNRMSFTSDVTPTPTVPHSKLIELGIPPNSTPNPEQQQQSLALQKMQNNNTETAQATTSIPRPLTNNNSTTYKSYGGRCFIMSYRTSKIASQLCFIERDVLVKVGWEELIHCKWTKMDASGNINPNNNSNNKDPFDEGPQYGDDEKINYTRQSEMRRNEEQGIEQVIQRFNTVCQWVSSEIVRTRNINERVKLIEKFIRLAKKCKMYSNYATLVQILLGLQSPAVARLEKTWSKVSTNCQKLLNKLTEFTSPMKNWKNIRDSMTEVAEEYGNSPAEVQVEMPGTTANKQMFKKTTRIKIPFGGCIPFLGIYLSDLVFNSEKPRYLKPNLESQKIYNRNNTRNMPACLDQPLVNFRKHRVIATVIKRVLTFQGLSMRYSFDADGILLEKCRNLDVLDAATIRELSASLE